MVSITEHKRILAHDNVTDGSDDKTNHQNDRLRDV